ncbi:MAG: cyclodeaminase/cyclohydrolase family protein [Planctomycetota bacterium]
MPDPTTIEGWLDSLASTTPTPGGGAASAHTAATASALTRMVLGYALASPRLAGHEPHNQQAADALDRARARALELAQADAEAYGALNASFKLPKDDPDRAERISRGAAGAVAPPTELLDLSAHILTCIESVLPTTSRMLSSDLAVAAALAEAAGRGAAWNIRANLGLLASEEDPAGRATRADEAVARCRAAAERIEAACRV